MASASKLAAATTGAARPPSAAGASGVARPQGASGGVVSSGGGSMPDAGGSVLGGAGARASAGEADPAEIRRRRLGKEDNHNNTCLPEHTNLFFAI